MKKFFIVVSVVFLAVAMYAFTSKAVASKNRKLTTATWVKFIGDGSWQSVVDHTNYVQETSTTEGCIGTGTICEFAFDSYYFTPSGTLDPNKVTITYSQVGNIYRPVFYPVGGETPLIPFGVTYRDDD